MIPSERPEAAWKPQPGPQTLLLSCPVPDALVGGARGGGKGLPNDPSALVCTPKGWKPVPEVMVGDTVTDPTTGGHCRVIGRYPMGEKECYRITFDDGAECVVTDDHLWAFRRPNHIRPGTRPSSQREYASTALGATVPAERWRNLRVGTTLDLMRLVDIGERPRIPLTEPVLFTVNGHVGGVSLSPYLLGLFLGDGSSGNMTITSVDDEIREYLVAEGFVPVGGVLHSDGKPSQWMAKGAVRKTLRAWMTNHGLSGRRAWEKFVPASIRTADLEYRVEFLRGLMDTDGTVDERGRCYFISTSKDLAEGVQELVRGLGGKASIRQRQTSYTYLGEKKDGRPSWQLRLWLRKTSAMFRLERKRARCLDSWNGGYELMREVVSVEPIGARDSVCFRVDSVYGLFVTNGYVVTHNSDALIGDAAARAGRYGAAFNGLFIRRTLTELADVKRRMFEIYPKLGAQWAEVRNEWKFPNGGILLLAYLDEDRDADRYQGRSLCVGVGTPVLMASGEWKPIEAIRIGEEVSTLEGPRCVVDVTLPYDAPCVTASVSVPGVGEVARQVHPIWHHVLTTDGVLSGSSPREPQTPRLLPGAVEQALEGYLPLRRPRREGWLSYEEDGRTDSVGSDGSRREGWQPPPLICHVALHGPAFRSALARRIPSDLSSGFRTLEGCEPESPMLSQGNLLVSTDQKQRPAPSRPSVDHSIPGALFSRDRTYAGNVSSAQDSRDDYRLCCRFCGERTLPFVGIDQDALPSLDDAGGPGRGDLLPDEMGISRGCTRCSGLGWVHFYTGEVRDLLVDLVYGEMSMAYVGVLPVADITVEHAGHYITDAGVVNRNTWIGIDEVGNFPSPDPIDKLWATLRSSSGVPAVRRMSCNPGGAGHCVDRGEVLTPSGWRDIRNILVGDRVYTVDRDGSMFESVVDQTHSSWYSGEMIRVDSRGLYMSCTPNHKVAKAGGVKRSRSTVLSLVPFERLPGQATVVRSVKWSGPDSGVFTVPRVAPPRRGCSRLEQPDTISLDDFAELMGWFLSEGCAIRRAGAYRFDIAQTKPRGIAEIDRVLTACGFKYKWQGTSAQVHSKKWAVYMSGFGKCRDKYIPAEIKAASPRIAELFVRAAMAGDGHWASGNGGTYYTTSRRLSDDFMEIALKAGYTVYRSSRQRADRVGLSYAVNIKKTKSGGTELLTGNHVYDVDTATKRRSDVKREWYDGQVYCIGVPETHSFILRQRGSVWVSGNSWVFKRYIKGRKPGVVFEWQPQPDFAPHLKIQSVFIPSRLENNLILMKNDPSYELRIAAAGSAALYRAWRYGDWDVLAGGYFDIWDRKTHVAEISVQPWWEHWISIDWGFSHDSAIYWYAYDGKKIHVYQEYCQSGFDPIRLALEIVGRTPPGVMPKSIYMSHDAFARRVSERSIALDMDDVFVNYGWPRCTRAESDRISGWQAIYRRLVDKTVVVSPRCSKLVDVMPTLVRDPDHPEDILKVDGDDPADSLRYGLASRREMDPEMPDDMKLASMITSDDPHGRAMQARIALTKLGSGSPYVPRRAGHGRWLGDSVGA